MLKRVIKISGIILAGAILFVSAPFISHAQYAYAPSVSTGNATDITPMNATFNGTVNTAGISGNGWFEYGTDLNFGNSTTLDAFNFSNGYNGNYSTNVSGLTANTTYYFRAVAQNSFGRVYGNVVSFTTDFSTSGNNNLNYPTAVTTSGAVLADNVAQFNALILPGNTNNANTFFEWGTTPGLGNQTASVPVSGSPAIRHTNTITGLNPGTIYYFRAVAQNSFGESDGAILILKTSGSTQNRNEQNSDTNISTDKTTSVDTTTADTTTINKTENENSTASMLGANVASANSFFPINLFGWLFLIILISLLALLGKYAYAQFKK
jgi:phosphodiesterase/alkaline phosphatase D-like protein